MTVASVAKTWATNDPFTTDGLGTSTPLGVGFLRSVVVTMNDDTTVALTAADFGFTYMYSPISIMGNTASNTGYFPTSIASTGFTLNAPQSTVVLVVGLGRGI